MSTAPVLAESRILPMSPAAIQRVREWEAVALQMPQVPIVTRHVIHAGMYARTIRIPAGVVLTGAFIRIPTMLIVSGHAQVFVDGSVVEIAGYQVVPASAGRKQAFLAIQDTDLTMLFPTSAATVEDAEDEFTDEPHLLFSRHGENEVLITGE